MAAETNQNQLLRRLPPAELSLLGRLERVELPLRMALESANKPTEYVYFIESGMASVTGEATGKSAVELAVIGRDGLSGLGLALGDGQAPFETFMQVEGSALRVSARQFQDALTTSPALRETVQLYSRALTIQIASTALSNGRSKLEERLARWLLMVSDRTGPSFSITHEFISIMLAVRRSGVTLAMQLLEGRGLIRAGRGNITVIDRNGLIVATNGAYGLAEREYKRLLGQSD